MTNKFLFIHCVFSLWLFTNTVFSACDSGKYIYNPKFNYIFHTKYYILISLLFFNNTACTKTNINQKEQVPMLLQSVEPPLTHLAQHNNVHKLESMEASERIEQAQQHLDLLGYQPSEVNGKLNAKTQAALKAFQEKSQLPVTGKLDDITFKTLDKAVQDKLKPTANNSSVSPPITDLQEENSGAKEELLKPSTSDINVDINTIGVHLIAAKLAELGYFSGNLIKQAKLEQVKIALKSFQRDIKVNDTGFLDEKTRKILDNVKLSQARKAELEVVITNKPVVAIDKPVNVVSDLPSVQKLPPSVAQKTEDNSLTPITSPVQKKQNILLNPIIPPFTLEKNESVFVLEEIKCKSQYEALVLYYKGQLQIIENDKIHVKVNKRYAMWYDTRRQGRYEGISKTDWWCIPRKRFCYSPISFSGWGGKLKPGKISHFKKMWTMPSRFDIVTLVTKSSQDFCQLSGSKPNR